MNNVRDLKRPEEEKLGGQNEFKHETIRPDKKSVENATLMTLKMEKQKKLKVMMQTKKLRQPR